MVNLHFALYVLASVLFAVAAFPPSRFPVRWEWLGICALSLTLWV